MSELDNYGRKVIYLRSYCGYYGLGYCDGCGGERLMMCRECGSFHVHNNAACGDPGCCGPNEDFCVDCQSTELEYYA